MSNEHISEYLEYFINLRSPPHYAVMINGPWGIGKTHFVKNLIKDWKRRERRVLYASLYGVKTTEQVDQLLVFEIMPVLSTPAFTTGGRIAKAWAQKFGLVDAVQFKDVVSGTGADLMIFDDLERAVLSPKEVLGYVNQFVEHEDRKVVIIGDESKIDGDTYLSIREKVIGRTFTLQPDVAGALATFVREMPSQIARQFVDGRKDVLLTIFQQSGSPNLRVLRQTIWDWDRYFLAIDANLREKQRGMLEAFKLFVALSIELRTGRLKPADLRDRAKHWAASIMAADKEGKQASPYGQAEKRYPDLRLHDRVLSDDVIDQFLVQGRVMADSINESLRVSEYFVLPEDEPAWQKVWHGITRPFDEFSAAFDKMEQQFKSRQFVKWGEVLHVFGLRLWASEIGHLNLRPTEVEYECRAYVDDLAKSDRIREAFATRPRGGAPEDDGAPESAYGLAIYRSETQEHRDLRAYYRSAWIASERAVWPRYVSDVMKLMNDPVKFYSVICANSDETTETFADVPIFAAADALAFVEQFLGLLPQQQRDVLKALQERYSGGRLQHGLAAEKTWIAEIHGLLMEKAASLPPIRKFAIKNEVGRLIRPLLDQ